MPSDSPFTATRALGRRDLLQITDTQAVDNPSGTKALGQFQFDPNLHPLGSIFQFEALLWTSKGSITGSVQLYNVTDAEAVTGTSLTTSSTSPVQDSSGNLTVGAAAGNLKDTAKIYEARISVSGTDASDILSVGSVHLRVI